MLSYCQSHHQNCFQKLFTIYLKFKGLSAKAFDTLHALGLVMSHKWTGNAVSQMSKRGMEEVVQLIKKFSWLISHNNVNIPFCVFSQRLDNKGEFGNGTVATVYIKRDATPLTKDINWALQEHRSEGLKNPISALDIFKLSMETFPRIYDHATYYTLQFLLKSP